MGELRIIAGTWRGRRIRTGRFGEAGTLRPTSDRVRTSLFDRLAPDLPGARVLDLFAGTGALGIEALSRGAEQAVFIDKAPAALQVIRANLEHTRLAERAIVLRADAFKYLAGPITAPFDLIYVAPPQYHGLWAAALRALDARPAWLSAEPGQDSGVAVVQIHPREYEELPLRALVQYDQRKYGSTLLCFYELAP